MPNADALLLKQGYLWVDSQMELTSCIYRLCKDVFTAEAPTMEVWLR